MKIEYRDISVKINGTPILQNVDLIAKDKQITGIIGPNGCGKSTLIKAFFEIVKTNSGTIHLNERDRSIYTKKQIASLVGYVGQESGCSFDFSVEDVIGMALYHTGSKRMNQITNAMEELKIVHLAKRSILTLSGGEKKLVYLARAIAGGADTILLDEPTNHLDIKHQLDIMDYLKNCGKTIIIVLHDLQLAAHYMDSLYLMEAGKIVCHGNVYEVLTKENVKRVFGVNGEVIKRDSENYKFELKL